MTDHLDRQQKRIEDLISETSARLRPFEEAEKRAREILPTVPRARLYFGICGVSLAFEQFEVREGFLRVRKVSNAPGIVHVARAADLTVTDYLGVSRYSSGIQAEIAAGNPGLPDEHNEESFMLDVAWHTAALVKLRGHPSLFCPASAECSWDTVSAVSDNKVRFHMLDDVPRQIVTSKGPSIVSLDDMEWVKTHWDSAFALRDHDHSRRFGLAFNLAYTWNQTHDLRVGLANLWIGLEALFGDQTDKPVTSKLAERVSGWIPSVSVDEIRRLYSGRCDALHGRWIEAGELSQCIAVTEGLLRRALALCIEKGSVPLPDWH